MSTSGNIFRAIDLYNKWRSRNRRQQELVAEYAWEIAVVGEELLELWVQIFDRLLVNEDLHNFPYTTRGYPKIGHNESAIENWLRPKNSNYPMYYRLEEFYSGMSRALGKDFKHETDYLIVRLANLIKLRNLSVETIKEHMEIEEIDPKVVQKIIRDMSIQVAEIKEFSQLIKMGRSKIKE